MQSSSAVVLGNEVCNLFGQANLFSESETVGYVAGDDLRTLHGTQTIMRILSLLVLNKIFRGRKFSNVMVKRTNSGQQWIGADGAARIFGELTHRM